MISGSFPMFPEVSMAEAIAWGRLRLTGCTGKDFGYDLEAWHEYLVKSDDGWYKCENRFRVNPERIQEALANDSWLAAVASAQSKRLFEKIIEEAQQKKEAEELAKRTWAGKYRNCPKCQTGFKSIKDRGQCPKCGHLFFASQTV